MTGFSQAHGVFTFLTLKVNVSSLCVAVALLILDPVIYAMPTKSYVNELNMN